MKHRVGAGRICGVLLSLWFCASVQAQSNCPPPLEHGKARVSSTTTKLSCAAYHRFRSQDGSIQEHALAFVKNVARTGRR